MTRHVPHAHETAIRRGGCTHWPKNDAWNTGRDDRARELIEREASRARPPIANVTFAKFDASAL